MDLTRQGCVGEGGGEIVIENDVFFPLDLTARGTDERDEWKE